MNVKTFLACLQALVDAALPGAFMISDLILIYTSLVRQPMKRNKQGCRGFVLPIFSSRLELELVHSLLQNILYVLHSVLLR